MLSFLKKNIWPIIGVSFLVLLAIAVHYRWLHTIMPSGQSVWVPFAIGFSALVDSLNPCAFSILFLMVGFLFSLGRTRSQILGAGFLYVFGIFITYMFIGLIGLKILKYFQIPISLSVIGAGIIILAGLILLLNVIFPNFPIKLKIPHFAHKQIAPLIEKGTKISAFVLGVAVGLFEFPCTGGPYLFVVSVLHDHAGGFWIGLLYLIIYNLIFILPLTIVLLVVSNPAVLQIVDKIRRSETKKSRLWIALAMIALGLLALKI
jgi:cytochrome c biogenesis protein CcdA